MKAQQLAHAPSLSERRGNEHGWGLQPVERRRTLVHTALPKQSLKRSGILHSVYRWRPLNDPEAAQLVEELRRELVGGHPLYGRAARAVAPARRLR